MADRFEGMTRLQRIGETLYPSDQSDPIYCAEPLDIEDARWLYDHVNGCPELMDDLLAALKLAQRWLANCMPVADLDGPKPLPVIAAVLAKVEGM